MGRFAGFLAEILASARAIAEVVVLLNGRRGGRAAPPADLPPDDAPAGPAVVAPVDQPPGPPLGEPEVRGPQAGLTDPV